MHNRIQSQSYFQPNFLITYLRRGRLRQQDESEVIIQEREVKSLPPRSLSRPDEGHKLCVRFSNTVERPSNSVHSNVMKGDVNLIDIIAVEDVRENSDFNTQPSQQSVPFQNKKCCRKQSTMRLRRTNSPMLRRRENRLTRISLAMVWLFLFCHVWKLIPTTYEVFFGSDEYPKWMFTIKHLSHALIVLNSSVNFLIYIVL